MDDLDSAQHDLDRLLPVTTRQVPAPGQAPGRPGRMRNAWAGLGTIATTLLIVGLAVVLLANSAGDTTSSPPPSALAVGPGADATPSVAPLSSPAGSSSPSPAAPSLESPPAPSAAPTERPTALPTEKPTPKATKEPQPDPEPEPTTRVYAGSGPLGEPLTVHGVTLTMRRTDVPAAVGSGACESAGREAFAYVFRMTWDNPKGSVEPWIAVGQHPYNVVWFEPRFAVNEDVVTVVCHKPGDNDKVLVESSPDGVPMTVYQWRFAP